MANYYLMICSSSYNNEGHYIEAYETLKYRLKNKYWPLYANTRNRISISEGDQLAFYVSGTGECGGQIVGNATISEIATKKAKIDSFKRIEEKVSLGQDLYSILILSSIETNTKRKFKEHLHEMSFSERIPRKWGSLLQGGCRKLNRKDFDILCQKSPK